MLTYSPDFVKIWADETLCLEGWTDVLATTGGSAAPSGL